MVEILFSRERVPENVSNKRRDIGLVWELLAPSYGLLRLRNTGEIC